MQREFERAERGQNRSKSSGVSGPEEEVGERGSGGHFQEGKE